MQCSKPTRNSKFGGQTGGFINFPQIENHEVAHKNVIFSYFVYFYRADSFGKIGGSISINCEPSGVPPPVVSWTLPSG